MVKKAKTKSQVLLGIRTRPNGIKTYYLDFRAVGGKRVNLGNEFDIMPGNSREVQIYNKHIASEAEKIRLQYELDFRTRKILNVVNGSEDLLCDFVKSVAQDRSFASSKKMMLLHWHLLNYDPEAILQNVDYEFLKGFIKYLSKAKSRCSGKPLSNNTARQYLDYLNLALKQAVKLEKILVNPFSKIDRNDKQAISGKAKRMSYLDIEELEQLMNTPITSSPYDYERAFVFCCYTGLRISDVSALRWSDLKKHEEGWSMTITTKKTDTTLTIPINPNAIKWLPQRRRNSPFVFDFPGNLSNANVVIKRWVKAAGIKKDVSFHTSRHTFATILITLGADLYVVSELLGHSDVKTTQIYAEVVDQRKNQAIELMNGIKITPKK